jgi:hypothetical protein
VLGSRVCHIRRIWFSREKIGQTKEDYSASCGLRGPRRGMSLFCLVLLAARPAVSSTPRCPLSTRAHSPTCSAAQLDLTPVSTLRRQIQRHSYSCQSPKTSTSNNVNVTPKRKTERNTSTALRRPAGIPPIYDAQRVSQHLFTHHHHRSITVLITP